MINKSEIKKSLPHGYLKKIAKKAGVSQSAVTHYFNDYIKKSERIERATLEVAIEYRKAVSPLVNKLKSFR